MADIYTFDFNDIVPTKEDFQKLLSAKMSYEVALKLPKRAKETWRGRHFNETPWGIGYNVSKPKFNNITISNTKKGKPVPAPYNTKALKYFIAAVAIDWQELIDQLKRTLKIWGYTSEDLKTIADQTWLDSGVLQRIADALEEAQQGAGIKLIEAIEKHSTLNPKLFTKDGLLKEKVRAKMLEIVDEFLDDLKKQNIQIKVDDILFIGSNASYNYTKDSDIDLHIIAKAKETDYPTEVADAIYSAYRSLFNKKFDISFFGIPLELYVEIETTPRVSNGMYSVKKDKWIKKPVHEDIPDYDKEALAELVDKWETKCKDIIDKAKADELKDEKKIIKLISDLYDKLRKEGLTKGEYSLGNLAFKELRNNGYLDTLKDYRNELISKRLSLEEELDRQTRLDVYNQISRAVGTQPIIQDNGLFFIYNIKPSEINSKVRALKQLDCVVEVHAYENGKYDFSNVLDLAMNKMPSKYYDIRGKVKE